MRALDNLLAQLINKEKFVDVGVGYIDESWFITLKTPRAWLEDQVSKIYKMSLGRKKYSDK